MEKIFSLDLHTHLHEKGVKPKDYWKRVKEMGLDAVAITEHPQFEPRDAFEKLLELKPKDVLLIPGSELNSEFGHLLCYGKKKDFYDQSELFKKGVAVETVLDIAKRKG
ncbi:MAG: PHP domain-containing protein, partial [Candidatus Diapherotrites archaeon]|nr:PHP domain-containing protein [Candidatus Diapherotrites archaeon]